MKLIDTLLLYPAFALLIIGLHQIVTRGFAQSYWILMLALIFLYGYQWRRIREQKGRNDAPPASAKPTSKKKKK